MKFYIPDHGETADDAQEFPHGGNCDTSWAARVAADWYHARRNGWEANWPIVFVIIDEIGKEHRFNVEREMVPEFLATKI